MLTGAMAEPCLRLSQGGLDRRRPGTQGKGHETALQIAKLVKVAVAALHRTVDFAGRQPSHSQAQLRKEVTSRLSKPQPT